MEEGSSGTIVDDCSVLRLWSNTVSHEFRKRTIGSDGEGTKVAKRETTRVKGSKGK